MTEQEFLEEYFGKISSRLWWHCYWFIGESYEFLNGCVKRALAVMNRDQVEKLCCAIAMKQLLLKKQRTNNK